jgi:hypothetical protein
VYVGGSAGQGICTISGGTLTIFVSLNVASTAGSYVNQSGGTLYASFGTSNNGNIQQTGGTSYLSFLSGTGSITVGGGTSSAAMTVASLNQSAATINSMGTLKVIGGSDNVVNSLTINGGQLDLTNTHLFIDYGSGPDPISSIAAWIASGYAGGAWNGPGIMSTTAQSNSTSYGIGYADSADPGNPAGLPSGTIEIKYTLLGDANLDGVVNAIDFGIMAANFNKGVTGWDKGDFNYDNVVSAIDFGELAANFNKGASGAQFGGSALSDPALVEFAQANGLMADVPEPVTIGLLGTGALAGLTRRRRRNY